MMQLVMITTAVIVAVVVIVMHIVIAVVVRVVIITTTAAAATTTWHIRTHFDTVPRRRLNRAVIMMTYRRRRGTRCACDDLLF